MARVYSQRLLEGATTATSYLAMVPAGVLWVVRDARFFWNGSSDHTVEIFALSILGTVDLVLDWGAPPSAGAQVLPAWEGRQVLVTGETLQFSSTTETWQVSVTGYALALP